MAAFGTRHRDERALIEPMDDDDTCLCELGLCSGCDHFDCHLE